MPRRHLTLLLLLSACAPEGSRAPEGSGVELSLSEDSEITVILDHSTEDLYFGGAVRTPDGVRFFGSAVLPDHDEPLVQVASAQFGPACAVDALGAVICFDALGTVALPSLGSSDDPALAVSIEYMNLCALTLAGEVRCLSAADLATSLHSDLPVWGWEDGGEVITWTPPAAAVEVQVGVNYVVVRLINDELWKVSSISEDRIDPATESLITTQVAAWDGADPDPLFNTATGEGSWDLPESLLQATALAWVGCAVDAGEAQCWLQHTDPEPVTLPAAAQDVHGHFWYPPVENERPVCALLEDDTVWCWGNDLEAEAVDWSTDMGGTP